VKKFYVVLALGLLLVAGCTQKSNPVSQEPSTKSIVAVSINSGYSAGNIGVYNISDSATYPDLMSISSDNDIRTYNGSTYVLDRVKDNIIKISGSIIADSTVVYEKNIGASVDIQDVAFISSTKAYITQYSSAQLVIFDPSTGIKLAKRIDLSAFNSHFPYSATVPYMSRELYYNGNVYVACQRLAIPTGSTYETVSDTSEIAVINTVSDSVIKTIKLIYKNPQELSICNGKLYVASVGSWGVNDGGVECIDLATGTNLGSIINESAFGGDLASFIVISDTKGYAVVSSPSYTNDVITFNPQAKTIGAKIAGIDNACSGHLAFDSTYIYIGDRSNSNPGIVIIDPSTDTKAGATKNIGLPPNSLSFLEVQ